jgi:branched-chain amino acid transport system permease protein
MMGAFVAYLLLNKLGIGYWWALLIVPLVVGATGVVIERLMLKSKLYKLDHLYGLLLTFGLALIIQGLFRNEFGSSGQPYQIPEQLQGGRTSASCSCPTTAAGSSSPRSSSAWPPGS